MVALLVRLSLLLTGLVMLIGLLPDSSGLPVDVTNALNYFVGVARTFDWLVPLNTLFTVFKLFVVFEVALVLFRVLRWMLHLFSATSAGNS